MRHEIKRLASSARPRRAPLLLIFLLILCFSLGCLEIWAVNQPSSVTAGEDFQVTVEFVTDDGSGDGSTRFGAIKLPVGFTVNSVFYGATPLPEDPAFETQLTNDFPPGPGYYWWVGTTTENDHIGGVAYINVTAGGAEAVYGLDYRVGFDTTYEDEELNVPLEVIIDTDGDGIPDSFENAYGCMQANTVDALLDYDSDFWTNLTDQLPGVPVSHRSLRGWRR